MMISRTARVVLVCAVVFWSAHALAGGGFLGIDHRLNSDSTGIWSRDSQNVVLCSLVSGAIIGGLWEGAKPGSARLIGNQSTRWQLAQWPPNL